jgi:hypothetical protein
MSTSTVGLPRESKIYSMGQTQGHVTVAVVGKKKTFLSRVNFIDGHGGYGGMRWWWEEDAQGGPVVTPTGSGPQTSRSHAVITGQPQISI